MKKVSILGAGGKMGHRVSKKLNDAGKYDLKFIEISQEGKNRLKGLGIDKFTPYEEAVPVSDVVIPDTYIPYVFNLWVYLDILVFVIFYKFKVFYPFNLR